MRTRLALIVASLTPLYGCAQPCVVVETEVQVAADAIRGPAPLAVHFTADAHGTWVGCSSHDNDTEVVGYQWDFDGDGGGELVGPLLTEVDYVFQQRGQYLVEVTVTDSAGDEASATITLMAD